MNKESADDFPEGRLEWFGGNVDALAAFNLIARLSHIWDDIVDGDKELSVDDVNEAFLIALVYLPNNPFYNKISHTVRPMLVASASAYATATAFERSGDEHGIEIAHMLRYSAGFVAAYMVELCVGRRKAQQFMPDVWKTIVAERFDEYRNEHLKDGKK